MGAAPCRVSVRFRVDLLQVRVANHLVQTRGVSHDQHGGFTLLLPGIQELDSFNSIWYWKDELIVGNSLDYLKLDYCFAEIAHLLVQDPKLDLNFSSVRGAARQGTELLQLSGL